MNKIDFFQDLISKLSEKDISTTYNGINYIGSVKRHLYTVALNSVKLENFLIDIQNEKFSNVYIYFNIEEYDLAKLMIRNSNFHPLIFFVNIKIIKYFIKYLLNLFQFNKYSNVQKSQFFIFIHHSKFIPLVKKLFQTKESNIYFVATDQNLKEISYPNNIKIVKLISNFNFFSVIKFRYIDISTLINQYEIFFLNNSSAYVLTFEGDASYNEILAIISKKFNHTSICFQWGAFPWESPKIGFRDFSHDYYLTWGEYFSEQLLKYNKNIFKEIGNPLINQKITSPNKKIIFLHQGYDDIFIKKHSYQKFWELMIKLSTSLKDWEIIIRNHPNIPLSQTELKEISENKIIQHDPLLFTLSDSFANVSIAVTIMSSAIIEASATGIIPIIFNPNIDDYTFKPEYNKLGMGWESENIDFLYNKIIELTSNREKISTLRHRNLKMIPNIFHKLGDESIFEFQKCFFN